MHLLQHAPRLMAYDTTNAAGTDHSLGKAAESLKAQLHDLEDERKAATLKAETMATKARRLGEAIENLQEGALRAMRQSDEAAARELLQVSILKVILACKNHRFFSLVDHHGWFISNTKLVGAAGKDSRSSSNGEMQGSGRSQLHISRETEQADRCLAAASPCQQVLSNPSLTSVLCIISVGQ